MCGHHLDLFAIPAFRHGCSCGIDLEEQLSAKLVSKRVRLHVLRTHSSSFLKIPLSQPCGSIFVGEHVKVFFKIDSLGSSTL
jgi:hypothetical protein